jgi:hypothetical protein
MAQNRKIHQLVVVPNPRFNPKDDLHNIPLIHYAVDDKGDWWMLEGREWRAMPQLP